MYESYWGLESAAFDPSPDPKFVYLAPAYEEALLLLHHHFTRRSGIAVLSGESGSGRTSLLRRALGLLPNDVELCIVSGNGGETSLGSRILDVIRCHSVEVDLNSRLDSLHDAGRKVAIALDDAHRGDVEANFRQIEAIHRRHPWIATAIVGDFEVASRATADLGSTFDLAWTHTLQHLSTADSAALIAYRLRVAGLRSEELPFTNCALTAIAGLCGGNPRLTVQWSDHALLTGFTESRSRVDGALVTQLARNLRGAAA